MSTLISLAELEEGRPRGVSADGKNFIVIRYRDKIYTYINSCPHLGVPLEWNQDDFLNEEGELLRCATHGALFTIEDGLCVDGPCYGDFLGTVRVHIEDDLVKLVD